LQIPDADENKKKDKENWASLIGKRIEKPSELPPQYKVNIEEIEDVTRKFPMRISQYYFDLIEYEGDPIWKQCVPDKLELEDFGMEDPLNEEGDSPVPGLTHRYPDRVLLLVSNQCAMYCRFCTRKRRVGHPLREITMAQIMKGVDYIRENPQIRDVILSGGDPLMLNENFLEEILKELRAIPHVQIIRIGTRIPCALPQRITENLCSMLKKYHPLYINTHFNHPREITPEARKACEMLADAGIPLGCQTVLLRGVNDSPAVMKELMQKLVEIRVKPYYIYQCDLARGNEHFRTPLSAGLEIMEGLRGHTSGMCVPQFVIDAPGGGGKIPLQPDYIVKKTKRKITLRNYSGRVFEYPEPLVFEVGDKKDLNISIKPVR
jgi:lysine 2,3-aminomutase